MDLTCVHILVVTKEPYVLQEKGWGEFDMRIVLNFANNVATEVLLFDLSFMQSSYSVIRTIVSYTRMDHDEEED